MWRVLAGILGVLIFNGCAAAQEIPLKELSLKTQEAETLAGQGKFVEAIAALDEAAAALWDRSPLAVRRALWVAETPSGFGAYKPRDNNMFAPGAPMIAYAEPIGFGWLKTGDVWTMRLVIDLAIKSKDGAELMRKSEFQTLEFASRVRNREFMTHLTYTFTGVPPGDYVVDTTLHDTVSGKSGTFSLPFVIR
jgi:hypothetical protein